jgi:hypothetical protein
MLDFLVWGFLLKFQWLCSFPDVLIVPKSWMLFAIIAICTLEI